MGILADIFGDAPRVKILEVFVENPKDEISVPEIERISDVSKVTIYTYIEELKKEGLIEPTRRIDKATLYRINLENPTAQALVAFDRSTLLKKFERVMEEEGIEVEKPPAKPKRKDQVFTPPYPVLVIAQPRTAKELLERSLEPVSLKWFSEPGKDWLGSIQEEPLIVGKSSDGRFVELKEQITSYTGREVLIGRANKCELSAVR